MSTFLCERNVYKLCVCMRMCVCVFYCGLLWVSLCVLSCSNDNKVSLAEVTSHIRIVCHDLSSLYKMKRHIIFFLQTDTDTAIRRTQDPGVGLDW